MGVNINGKGLSTTELRGGPALRTNGTKNLLVCFRIKRSKKFTGEGQFMVLGGNEKIRKKYLMVESVFGYRPSKSLKITLSPNYNWNNDELQYVTQQDYSNKTDYIFARIHQKTLSASLRINYIITPNLSIQYWGQPFIATGKYTEFKRITDSRADSYTDRFALIVASQMLCRKRSLSCFGAVGNELYTFDQPDFNVKEFCRIWLFDGNIYPDRHFSWCGRSIAINRFRTENLISGAILKTFSTISRTMFSW